MFLRCLPNIFLRQLNHSVIRNDGDVIGGGSGGETLEFPKGIVIKRFLRCAMGEQTVSWGQAMPHGKVSERKTGRHLDLALGLSMVRGSPKSGFTGLPIPSL